MADSLIGKALDRCRLAASLSGGEVLVGLSGGKDSLVTLDLVARCGAFSRIECFAMYLVPGLSVFEDPVRRAAERYNVPVHFVPHFELSRLLANGVLRFHLPAHGIRQAKQRDVEAALKTRTGINWFAYGERASDSFRRALDTRRCDGVEKSWHRLWPLWDWKDQHVYAYLKARKIPITRKFWRKNMDGVSLEPEALIAIQKRCPSDYEKILSVFPLAEVQVERYRRGYFEPVSKVRRPKSASKRSPKRPVQPAEDRRAQAQEAEEEPE